MGVAFSQNVRITNAVFGAFDGPAPPFSDGDEVTITNTGVGIIVSEVPSVGGAGVDLSAAPNTTGTDFVFASTDIDDNFRLRSITFEYYDGNPVVPEPGTLSVMSLGLLTAWGAPKRYRR